MTPRGAVLDLLDIAVAYGGIRAVHGLSLTIAEGEAVALLGPNGAGKSSTLNAIVGIAPTVGGRIVFDGTDITSSDTEEIVRMGVALVPEGRRVFGQLTVAENLTLGGAARGKRGGGAGLMRNDLLDLFPILRDRQQQLAGTLSGGEQQQLAIARGLMSNPQVLLLDEPSLGLAPQVTERIFELIGTLRRLGVTMLVVEQNADLALQLTDRTYVMAAGELKLSGPSADLRGRTELQQLYLGLGAAH